MILQRTIKKEVVIQGIGLHSGKSIELKLRPALPNQGISFIRTDIGASPVIPALYQNVIKTQMATTLGCNGVSVCTVEHLMAALHLLGVDNLIVEVSGPEIPIMDGSSEPFCRAILSVGLESQLQPRSYLTLRRKVELKLGEKWAVAEPASRLEIYGSIEWDHPCIGFQEFHYEEGATRWDELASARTFGFLWEVEGLKKLGLARGGSLDNAVVLDQSEVLNPSGLRFPDEFVKHKVLDALGDFKLAGVSINASIRLHRAGHDLHSQLLREIFKNPENFEITEEAKRAEVHSSFLNALLATEFAAG